MAMHAVSPQSNPMLYLWMAAAFASARAVGMLSNHYFHRVEDRLNPRTAGRPLATGALSEQSVLIALVLLGAGFILSCGMINQSCLILSPFVLTALVGYSLCKYVTSLYHICIGAVQLFGPVMAWLALTHTVSEVPILLGLGVLCSVAACDIVYDMVDESFDRNHGVKSFVVLFGKESALRIAQCLHGFMWCCVAYLGLKSQFGALFFVGLAALGLLLIYRYRQLDMANNGSIQKFFFQCNVQTGIMVFLIIFGSVEWQSISSA